MGISSFFKKVFSNEKPCVQCFQTSADILVSYQNILGKYKEVRNNYCRRHLIDSFSQQFLRCSHKMVIFEPQLEITKYTGLVYAYYPISSVLKYSWTKDEKAILEELLKNVDIHSPCQKCNIEKAQVLYFNHHSAPWESARILKEHIGSGEKLCLKCSLSMIVPILEKNPKNYIEGLYLPYDEDGFYLTTEI